MIRRETEGLASRRIEGDWPHLIPGPLEKLGRGEAEVLDRVSEPACDPWLY